MISMVVLFCADIKKTYINIKQTDRLELLFMHLNQDYQETTVIIWGPRDRLFSSHATAIIIGNRLGDYSFVSSSFSSLIFYA